VKPSVEKREGFKVIDVPPDSIGGSIGYRILWIYNWVLTELIPKQEEPLALVLAGDMIPIKPFNPERVLNGCNWAMQSGAEPGKLLAWLLLKKESACGLADLRNEKSVQFYPVSIYRPEGHIEWMEPVWVHLDKISSVELSDEKMLLLDKLVPDVNNKDWTFEKLDVPKTRPRRMKSRRDILPMKPRTNLQPLMKICEGCDSSYMDNNVLLCKHVDMPHGKNCLQSRTSRYMSILAMKNCPEGRFGE